MCPVKRRKKPIVIFDGDCGFCRTWIERWREITGERVEYAASRDVGHFFPDVDPKLYEQTVVLADTDGAIHVGAEAVFRALAHARGWGWPLTAYERVPGVSAVTEACYRFVAARRRMFSRITRWVWGPDVRLPTYHLVRWAFLRGLGAIFLIAFASLWLQVDGLIGRNGILPADSWLTAVREHYGVSAYWRAPTLFWFGASDQSLNLAGAVGLVASGMLLLNRFPRPAAFVAWAVYLSYFTVGGVFLSFQWDTLLLETGFLAILFAPSGVRPHLEYEKPPSRTVVWLYRWLLFRLMFLSGVVKLASGDGSWWDFSALRFHYETQPLPAWTSWYVHNLPEFVHRFSAGAMFFVELVVPFLIFAPRRLRLPAAALVIILQIAIMATGNYNFFNLLTVLLCVCLLDDTYCTRLLPARFARALSLRGRPTAPNGLRSGLMVAAAVLIFSMSSAQAFGRVYGYDGIVAPVRRMLAIASPLHLTSSYGLFAVMTKDRPEIILEGSNDGEVWKAYEFRWKPGDPSRAPRFCAPHQPRLDWQMWFAALGNHQRNPWVTRLMERILEGSPAVMRLLANNPFPERPPQFLRAVAYDYRFTSIPGRRAENRWWRRENPRLYAPVMRND